MKITGIRVYRHTVPYQPRYTGGERSVGPLDIYEEYARDIRGRDMPMLRTVAGGMLDSVFLEVCTDEGVSGIHGPVEYAAQLLTAVEGLGAHITGRDPMEHRLLWDIMSRFDSNSRAGIMMMAISAVDIALWDLKGSILGQPVYRILGGGRRRIRPYASMLGFPLEDAAAREAALAVKDMGIPAQKWFFRFGPGDGREGLRKNIRLAHVLREALGEDYELMFDCWMGWSAHYAISAFRELEPVRPMWVEEPFRPDMTEAYRHLKTASGIPISAGEHLYGRAEALPWLRDGLADVLQCDPEWCGGITEALRIGELCETFGRPFLPHGHSLLPALHVIAALPPDISPYAEYLLRFMDLKQPFFQGEWLGKDGFLTLPDSPGVAALDMERIAATEEIRSFSLRS